MRKNERHAAQVNGEIHYFTGKPCVHGHIALRFTSCAACTICVAIRRMAHQKTPESKFYIKNYIAVNKVMLTAKRKKWSKANPDKVRAQVARRRAAKLFRTPSWFTDGHLFEMECVYRYADALTSLGLKYEVDHIVPLQGKNVSGFHVPWNLQVITMSQNRSKGNKYHE